jgi:hypothetical protein
MGARNGVGLLSQTCETNICRIQHKRDFSALPNKTILTTDTDKKSNLSADLGAKN